MKLYVFRPEGFGQETFFIVESTKEIASEKIMKFMKENDSCWDFDAYKWEEYDIGEVATNSNS